MPFPLPFQLNQVTSPALDAVNPWQIKSADKTSSVCSKKKTRQVCPSNGAQTHPLPMDPSFIPPGDSLGLKNSAGSWLKIKTKGRKAQLRYYGGATCQVSRFYAAARYQIFIPAAHPWGWQHWRGPEGRTQFLGCAGPGDIQKGHNSWDLWYQGTRKQDTIPGICRARGHEGRTQFLGSLGPGKMKEGHNSWDAWGQGKWRTPFLRSVGPGDILEGHNSWDLWDQRTWGKDTIPGMCGAREHKGHNSWDLWGTPHKNLQFPEAAKPL